MDITTATARTAAEVIVVRPDLAVGAPVTVYPSWTRTDPAWGRCYRPHGVPGTVVAHVRNGYVRVREDAFQTCCDYDPRDVAKRLTQRCEPCEGMGREVYTRGPEDGRLAGTLSTRTCQACEGEGRV